MIARSSIDLFNVRATVAFVHGRIALDALGGSKIPEVQVGGTGGLSRTTALFGCQAITGGVRLGIRTIYLKNTLVATFARTPHGSSKFSMSIVSSHSEIFILQMRLFSGLNLAHSTREFCAKVTASRELGDKDFPRDNLSVGRRTPKFGSINRPE
jgi:hypothetical protein